MNPATSNSVKAATHASKRHPVEFIQHKVCVVASELLSQVGKRLNFLDSCLIYSIIQIEKCVVILVFCFSYNPQDCVCFSSFYFYL